MFASSKEGSTEKDVALLYCMHDQMYEEESPM